MPFQEGDGSNPELVFQWMFEVHVPDRVLIRYRKKLLSPLEVKALEVHLVVCPVCQLQLGDLPLPDPGTLVS